MLAIDSMFLIKLPTSIGSSEEQETSRKTSSALLTTPKPLTL